MKVRIGEPRIVPGPIVDVLYPGETATAHEIAQIGENTFEVRSWLVGPMPGWCGRWLRLKYRFFWRFLPARFAGPPKIIPNVHVDKKEDSIER